MDRTPITIAGQRETAQHPLQSQVRPGSLAEPARSLYVHVPFCFHKCHYCDFYSIVDTRDRQAPLTDRLIAELDHLAPFAGPLETVFIGGGTPTLLRPELWRRLLAALHDRFDLARAEFTVECNPETATTELFAILAGGGVNRVSIGAQSFSPTHLKTLERWHDPQNVGRAVELARQAGIERQSVDLIFAIPGQTLEQWQADLETALDLGVTHMSCYALTYEPNTAMTARMSRGDFAPAPEDLEADMLERTLEMLRSAGLQRYEVSNFATPGLECEHNLAYWRQEQWLAAGPSASGHVAGWRWKNVPRLDSYLGDLPYQGVPPAIDVEPPDPARALAERLMTTLRLREGLPIACTLARAAQVRPDLPERLEATALRYQRSGHLDITDTRWQLTDAGMMLADGIAAEFMSQI